MNAPPAASSRRPGVPIDPDPFGDRVLDDPYPYYRRMRDEAPVHWSPSARVFTISRYDEAVQVLRDPELFSSDAFRMMLAGRPSGGLAARARMMLGMLPALAMRPAAARILMARFLIAEDPPSHTEMRNIVNRAFTPRQLAAWEPRVRQVAEACWESVRKEPEFDLVAALAVPLPISIIVDLLGVEPERRADFLRWSDRFMAQILGPRRHLGLRRSGALDTVTELGRYVRGLVRARHDTPGSDLLSRLVHAQQGEGVLTETEAVFFAIGLLAAGHETTRCLIASSAHALLQHPDQLERVGRDPSLLPAVVEESLRWSGPVQFALRRARRATEIAGVPIPRHAMIVVRLASANRDQRFFGPDAEAFDVDRDARGHLAFSHGPHFCVGAGLARLEGRVALETMLEDLPRLRARDASPPIVPSYGARGLERLDVVRRAGV